MMQVPHRETDINHVKDLLSADEITWIDNLDNNNNKSELNSFENPLKKKLVLSVTQEEIPAKRRHIELNTKDDTKGFYGLPDRVINSIKKNKKIDKLYDWQDECIKKIASYKKKNFIYALPTSGGKTLVAEILMLHEILCTKKNAIFILPFVALVQEKVQSMTPYALEFGFHIEEYAGQKGHYPPLKHRTKNSLYICTIEKAQSLINYLIELNRLDEIGIIIVDELHLLGEHGGRGANLECLLTKVMFSKSNIQIIGMSATIGNLNEIACFLNAELYIQNFRPIEIEEYVKCEDKKWLVDLKQQDIFTKKEILVHQYVIDTQEKNLDLDFLGELVMDIVPTESCLVFCSTRKNCENVVDLLANVLDLHKKYFEMKNNKCNEKDKLLKSLNFETNNICPILQKTIQFGFAYHHSGLTAEERRLIEEAFRAGILCVICCTSTLATGVNLPARRVIIRSPYVGQEFLNISRYKQMTGRAGRAGLGETGESILVCKKKDINKVRKLLKSEMDDSLSSIHTEKNRGINSLITSAVGLSIACTRADLYKLASKTLLKVQESRLLKQGASVEKIVNECLVTLLSDGILEVKEDSINPGLELDAEDVLKTEVSRADKKVNGTKKSEKIINKLTDSTELVLSPFGNAASKGSIDLETANNLYKDLKRAMQNLNNKVDPLHLLYLVTPYDVVNQIKLIGNNYCDMILTLPEDKMKIATLIGITEAFVIKVRYGRCAVTPEIKRFYVTLMLEDLYNRKSIHEVAEKYQVDRGRIQNLLNSAISFSSSVARFGEELTEFNACTTMLSEFSQKLTYNCEAKLELLMELPFVQTRRAIQLHKAGYCTLQSIAAAKPEIMIDKVKYLSQKDASQIISAAKLQLRDEVENSQEEAEQSLSDLQI